MKIFHEENGKKVVYVQEKDVLYFIKSDVEILPSIVEQFFKNGITPIDSDQLKFIKIEGEKEVKFFEERDYILDYNKYKNFTEHQLDEEIEKVDKEVKRLGIEIKTIPENEVTKIIKNVEEYYNMEYLRKSIIQLKEHKENKLKIVFPEEIV